MKKQFGLFTKDTSHQTIEFAKKIITYLNERDVDVLSDSDVAQVCNTPLITNDSLPYLSAILSLGGDGTILRFHKRFPTCSTPIIGINLGGLGFLADIPVKSCFESLDLILQERYQVKEQMILEGSLRNGAMSAVNEFSIQRSSTPFLIDISISVDGRYFNTFSADGVIVSTPLGSTAYSLAAGGPILEPSVQAVVITPICPHTISTKPVVVMPESEITISCTTKGAQAEVIYDGTVGPILGPEDVLTIKISKRTFNMIGLEGSDFFSTLRSKMGWAGSLRS